MRIVTRYKDQVAARQAADYLTSQGIHARSWVHADVFSPTICVTIDQDSMLARARELLTEFDGLKPSFDEDLDSQARPDLSRLSQDLAPPCPSCGTILPLDANLANCPSCGAAADVVDLIVAAHGPEVLRYCYAIETEADRVISPEMIRDMDIPCPGCGYNLKGLSTSGPCPECGGHYDKRLILGL